MLCNIFKKLFLLAISLNCLAGTFSDEFKQHLEKLQPIQIQPMKEVTHGTSLIEQSRVPDLEPDGEPITLTIEQLEKLGSKYLTNFLEEMDEPEVIQVVADRETFELLLEISQTHPGIFNKTVTIEHAEKLLLAADHLNTDLGLIVPILERFNPEELCQMYDRNKDHDSVVHVLKQRFRPALYKNIGKGSILQHADHHITAFDITSDGQYIIAGTDKGQLLIWNATSEQLERTVSLDIEEVKPHGLKAVAS